MRKWTPRDIPSQAGKLAIVTGANSGIGFHTARHLARAGCEVIMACRSVEKGEQAKQQILQRMAVQRAAANVSAEPSAATLPAGNLEVQQLDLADLDSVRAFAGRFLATGRALDLLILNAGVMALPQRTPTRQGFEMQFGTNHLGHFALTALLLPALLRQDGSRVVVVSSIAHKRGRIHLDDLNSERRYQPREAYSQSKLANLIFGLELDRRLKRTGARTISVIAHPGVAATSIVSNGMGASLQGRITNVLFPLVAQSDDRGSWPTLYAATSPAAEAGHYYGPDGWMEIKGTPVEVEPKPHARDEAVAQRLWQLSEDLTGVRYDALAG
jgi:NAD(P)-dependent dehydrogenase (short-subunit alcohol dehydrogenase family)